MTAEEAAGTYYNSGTEYIDLGADGTGTVHHGATTYNFSYEVSGEDLVLKEGAEGDIKTLTATIEWSDKEKGIKDLYARTLTANDGTKLASYDHFYTVFSAFKEWDGALGSQSNLRVNDGYVSKTSVALTLSEDGTTLTVDLTYAESWSDPEINLQFNFKKAQ